MLELLAKARKARTSGRSRSVLAPEQDNYVFPAMLEARTASKEEQGGWAAEKKLVDGNLWKATL